MKCKYMKSKINKEIWCTRDNIRCTNCDNKEYDNSKSNDYQIKKKSKNLSKLERDRFSILVPSNKCCMCSCTTGLTWHEVFRGRNRIKSMKYGLCLRLCWNCHEKYQEDKEFNDYWHKWAQLKFIETYPDLDFLNIFNKNYL